MSFREGGAPGTWGRGFANLPMTLRLECNSKDYLIGCGLSFRIKVWHLPKTGLEVFRRGKGHSLCSPGSSPRAQPPPRSLNSLSAQEPRSVPTSSHSQFVLLLNQEREN